MKPILAKVKAAVASKDIASHLSHYLVKGRMIHASDNRMTAAAPFPFDGEFLVPSAELDSIAERFDAPTLEVEPTSVTFRQGKMKATLRTLPCDAVDYPMPKGDWSELPPAFAEALRLARTFVSDNAVHFWALAVWLTTDAIFATNNIVVARAECRGLRGADRLLPSWAVDYVLSRSDATVEALIADDNSMSFLWSDGSWMRAQLVDGKFPEAAVSLIANMAEPSFKISEEWKSAATAVCEMTEAVVEMRADRIVGATQLGQFDVEVETPVPADGGVSKWHKKFLMPVLGVADAWKPDTWPKPSPFSGPGIRGLIIGRS